MASIAGLALVVVEDDEDSRDLLEVFLEGQGANVRLVATAAEARAAIRERAPDVILTDITLPGEDGFVFLGSLRSDPATQRIPAIAVTGHTDIESRSRAIGAGFQKFVTKPFDLFSLVAAIASLAPAREAAPNETFANRAERLISERDMRELLAAINAQTEYRYTSILRFNDDRLESVWTFDRASTGSDAFPPDTPIAASYCIFVKEARALFAMSDSQTDARAAKHPKRDELRAYCGVPIFRADGSLFGTLCHYDERPQQIHEGTVGAMERVARLLTPALTAQ